MFGRRRLSDANADALYKETVTETRERFEELVRLGRQAGLSEAEMAILSDKRHFKYWDESTWMGTDYRGKSQRAPFYGVNYTRDPKIYNRLARMAKAGKMDSVLLDLRKPEQFEELLKRTNAAGLKENAAPPAARRDSVAELLAEAARYSGGAAPTATAATGSGGGPLPGGMTDALAAGRGGSAGVAWQTERNVTEARGAFRDVMAQARQALAVPVTPVAGMR